MLSLTVSSYADINNNSVKWDIDDEQINYFLYYLPSYKYFSVPTKVLRQYLDFNYTQFTNSKKNVSFFDNYQKICGVSDTQDLWVATTDTCSIDPTYNPPSQTFSIYISKNNTKSCIFMDIALVSTECPNTQQGVYDICKILILNF